MGSEKLPRLHNLYCWATECIKSPVENLHLFWLPAGFQRYSKPPLLVECPLKGTFINLYLTERIFVQLLLHAIRDLITQRKQEQNICYVDSE